MDFSLSQDQVLLQDSVKAYLDEACPLDAVRESAAGDASVAEDISRGLLDLGAGLILIPEEHGGLGLGLLDAALVQEMLGRSVAPVEHLATAMAIVGIGQAGTESQKSEWLPTIADGQARFAVALTEHASIREGAGVNIQGGRLNGKSLFVMGPHNASHLIVCDVQGSLHVASTDARGLVCNELRTIDKTRHFRECLFENVVAETLSYESEPCHATDLMVQSGRLLAAADSLGAAQEMLNKAVAYAHERKQFNRVIGSFQAVKHMCAEMAAQLEPARALIWHAAHAWDQRMDEAELMICLAKSHLSEVGTFVARTSTEVHGGMGFTDLLGLHYWFKRIGVNRQLLGGPELVRHEAARLQGWV
jgi:alkylation response protein AidB-like acyl-CoA dehydrogenase